MTFASFRRISLCKFLGVAAAGGLVFAAGWLGILSQVQAQTAGPAVETTAAAATAGASGATAAVPIILGVAAAYGTLELAARAASAGQVSAWAVIKEQPGVWRDEIKAAATAAGAEISHLARGIGDEIKVVAGDFAYLGGR